MVTVTSDGLVHHWAQGPLDVLKVRPFWAKRQDGWHSYDAKFYWFLEKVEGTTRAKALRELYQELRHPQSWERCGVRWVRTMDRAKANILICIVPGANTPCGPNAGGCYCDPILHGRAGQGGYCEFDKPAAYLGVDFIDLPGWAELVNMELCGHGTFRMHDMYMGEGHGGYEGVMGTWDSAAKTAFRPTDAEIEATLRWREGLAVHVHEHY